ncbi:MAG TPA: aldose 1-epimerase [Nitrospiraceae bacterium]|nr:aldose 1-epimerase [Nitrospiraceae bacterium]
MALELQSGPWHAVVHPEIGGALGSLRHEGAPVLREMPDEAVAARNVRLTACYPLVPYSNRIAHGVFRFEGAEYHVRKNFDNATHAIHGVGWQSAWSVQQATASEVVLSLRHRPQGAVQDLWPFAFDAEQRVALDSEGGVTLSLTVVNVDPRNMPAGLGWHPYFVRTPKTTLTFESEGAWLTGPDHLPAARARTAQWDFSHPRVVVDQALDNAFFGWKGVATLRDESQGKVITVTADYLFQQLVVFAPADRQFVAVEPVSNMTDALNRTAEPDHNLRVLAPGERLSGSFHIRVEPL